MSDKPIGLQGERIDIKGGVVVTMRAGFSQRIRDLLSFGLTNRIPTFHIPDVLLDGINNVKPLLGWLDSVRIGANPLNKKDYVRKLRIVIELENCWPQELSGLTLDDHLNEGAAVRISADYISNAYIEEVTEP